MSSVVRSVLTMTACLCQVAALVTGAYAHAIVINSEPADGGGGPPPHRLLLHFNRRNRTHALFCNARGAEERTRSPLAPRHHRSA